MQVGLAEKTVDEYLFHVWWDIAIHKRLWFCFLWGTCDNRQCTICSGRWQL